VSTPTAAAAATRRVQGIALFLLALLAFACYDAFAKHMVASHPPTLVNLSRYLAVSALALVLLARHGDWRLWRQPHQGLLWLRSLMLAIVATSFMTALVTMPLAEATAIYFTAPLLMVALSPWLLGEAVGRTQGLAVSLGFVGMLCIVRPGAKLPAAGTALMVLAAVCYALFQLLTRRLSGQIAAPVQFTHMALVCLVVTSLPALFTPPGPWPDAAETALLIGGGLLSGGAQLLLLAAFRRAELATLAPLNYLQLLLAVGISTLWFDRVPDTPALAGMALIAAAGLWLARVATRRPGLR